MPLSKKHRQEYTDAFSAKAGGKSSIALYKMKHLFRQMGFNPARYTDETIEEWLQEVDSSSNDDFEIDVDEFLKVIEKRTDAELLCARIRRFFKKLDDDRSGTVTKEEIMRFLESEGEFENAKTKMEALLRNVDVNNDGEITLDELMQAAFMMQATKKQHNPVAPTQVFCTTADSTTRKKPLSKKHRQEYTDAFAAKAGGKSSIALYKMKHLFRQMGFNPARYSDETIEEWLQEVDSSSNDDYEIDVDEFLKVIENRTDQELLCARIRRFFKKLDDDSSGTVTKEEIMRFLENDEDENAKTKMEALLRNADLDNDGEITLDELMQAVFNIQATKKQRDPRAPAQVICTTADSTARKMPLSKTHRQEYTDAFAAKAGGKSSIALYKMKHLFRQMGFDPATYTDETIEEWLQEVDSSSNDDYEIDVDEFLKVIENRTHAELRCARIRRFFKKLDDDSSGTVTKEEIMRFLENEGEGENAKTKLEALLRNVDVNNDGEITLDELLKAVKKKKAT